MAYKDGEEFTTYCDKLYDRHTYRLVFKDGRVADVEDYEYVRAYWHKLREELDSVVVVDPKKKDGGKGF
jgi:hypothetical protein